MFEWVEIQAMEKDLETALTLAIENGHGELVRRLLGVQSLPFYFSGLFLAIEKGHDEIVGQLLESGRLQVNYPNNEYLTPLHVAIRKGDEESVRWLLAKNGTTNRLTPLAVAAQEGRSGIVQLLLSQYSPECLGSGIREALKWAVIKGHTGTVRLLLGWPGTKAADHLQGNGGKWLCDAADGGHVGVIRVLLNSGVQVDARQRDDVTALYLAARGGCIGAVRFLLKEGADVNIKTLNNMTALHIAARNGYPEIVEALLEKEGMEVDAIDDEGKTPLYHAVEKQHPHCVRLLLEKGANPAFILPENSSGNRYSVLHLPAFSDKNASYEITDLLLNRLQKNKADIWKDVLNGEAFCRQWRIVLSTWQRAAKNNEKYKALLKEYDVDLDTLLSGS